MQHMHHDIRGEHDRQGHKQQGWGGGGPATLTHDCIVMYDVPYMQSNIISGSSGSNVGLFSFAC